MRYNKQKQLRIKKVFKQRLIQNMKLKEMQLSAENNTLGQGVTGATSIFSTSGTNITNTTNTLLNTSHRPNNIFTVHHPQHPQTSSSEPQQPQQFSDVGKYDHEERIKQLKQRQAELQSQLDSLPADGKATINNDTRLTIPEIKAIYHRICRKVGIQVPSQTHIDRIQALLKAEGDQYMTYREVEMVLVKVFRDLDLLKVVDKVNE